jgi:preprotein translocase subunit SecG
VGFVSGLLNVLLVISSLFLICLVLIQRGKGGGLAGAFGGVGGSSAFGTKAGDVFTRVTIITAGIWFLLAMSQVVIVNQTLNAKTSDFALDGETDSTRTIDLTGKKAAPTDKTAAPADTPLKSGKTQVKTDTSLPSALDDTPEPKSSAPAKKAP